MSGERQFGIMKWPARRRQAGSDRMLQNTNGPENSQAKRGRVPGVLTWGVIRRGWRRIAVYLSNSFGNNLLRSQNGWERA